MSKTAPVRSSQHRLFADYFQFYIQDELAEGNLGEAWSREAVARMIAVVPGVVGIGTFRNWHVPVTLEVPTENLKMTTRPGTTSSNAA